MDPAKCKRYRPARTLRQLAKMRIGPLSETCYFNIYFCLHLISIFS
ncbi:hypothetical protein M6B38_395175 [Iris pallida]|uniref:Ribosomal protein L16 n=1 Tax=Iris pallida TaxID=29817 RepID=A0AAX6FXB5_IRIPA|nr:hypothetical protein M6B38_395175 [Iris pallida]